MSNPPIPPSSAEPVVETDRLTHRYGARVALHEVSLSVRPGEVFAMLGPNGSGKTTLFRVLSTLIPPQDGHAAVAGFDLARQAPAARQMIGVVFQSPGLDKQLTAAENLRHQGHLYGLRGAELRARIDELLGRVGLAERASERVSDFSGGMRRRVELAKGMLHRPRVLLLDEPSTGLDPAARLDLWRLLDDIRRSDGTTVLLTTHLMDEADRCDRVAVMDAGRLVACDTPAALKERIGGDVVTLSARDPEAVREALRRATGIEADVVDATVRFERPRGHELIPSVIEALPGMVEAASVGKPTLEDVFLRLTGRRLGEDAREPEPAGRRSAGTRRAAS